MGLFDSAASSLSSAAQSVGSQATAAFGQLGSIGSIGSRLSSTLGDLANPVNLLSKIRSVNLPIGGQLLGKVVNTAAMFGGSDANNDWRVRLSIPSGAGFESSPVLQPLKDAGGLIFPYTPSINIASSASYDPQSLTHTNYPFVTYSSSKPSDIQISAPFFVEDAVQAAYWIACVHFMRTVTKMFTGEAGDLSGNPPPILFLNGYGDYVFKQVPVVVTSFSINLDASSDYIATSVGASFGGSGGGLAGTLGGIAGQANLISGLAGGIPALSKAATTLGAVSGGINAVSNLFSGGGIGGGSGGGATHVPTKSTMSVGLMPIYSRESVKQFNLQTFVNGGYVNNGVGYI